MRLATMWMLLALLGTQLALYQYVREELCMVAIQLQDSRKIEEDSVAYRRLGLVRQ
jgi:hypothetical protein